MLSITIDRLFSMAFVNSKGGVGEGVGRCGCVCVWVCVCGGGGGGQGFATTRLREGGICLLKRRTVGLGHGTVLLARSLSLPLCARTPPPPPPPPTHTHTRRKYQAKDNSTTLPGKETGEKIHLTELLMKYAHFHIQLRTRDPVQMLPRAACPTHSQYL